MRPHHRACLSPPLRDVGQGWGKRHPTHLANPMKTNQWVSTLFAHHHLPRKQERKTEVVCMEFWPHLCHHHLPRMQQQDRGGFMAFQPVHTTATTTLACKWETEVDWIFRGFWPRSHCHHLPHMQERDGGGFLGGFDPVHAASTSLMCKCKTEVVLWPFDPVHTATTSLTGKSEMEVGFMFFQPCSRCCHLPCMR